MNIYDFMRDESLLTLLMFFLVCWILHALLFRLPNRIIRGMNIRKHGWPPTHCDADGDFKKLNDEEISK